MSPDGLFQCWSEKIRGKKKKNYYLMNKSGEMYMIQMRSNKLVVKRNEYGKVRF